MRAKMVALVLTVSGVSDVSVGLSAYAAIVKSRPYRITCVWCNAV